MASTEEEILEILSSDTVIDLAKLRETSRFGLPDSVRGEVWKLLLCASKPDHMPDFSHFEENNTQHLELAKAVRGAIRRYGVGKGPIATFFRSPAVVRKFETVGLAYLSEATDIPVEDLPNVLHMLGPFIYSVHSEADIFFSFSEFMALREKFWEIEGHDRRLAKFLMLVRSRQPELFRYLEEEEVDPGDWASSWMSTFLARELPMQCILRLWDTYFSTQIGLGLHTYVCLAILQQIGEDLIELEAIEITGYLQHLPDLDMDQIIEQAFNLIADLEERQLL